MKRFIIMMMTFLGLLSMNVYAEKNAEEVAVMDNSVTNPDPYLTSVEGPSTLSVNQVGRFYAYPDMSNVENYQYKWWVQIGGESNCTIDTENNMCYATFHKSGNYLLCCQLVVMVNGRPTYPSTFVATQVVVE